MMIRMVSIMLVLLCAVTAWAYQSTIRVEFDEATLNNDGTPLLDLDRSRIEIRNAQDQPVLGVVTVPATALTGGGHILRDLSVEVPDTAETYSILASHVDTSGNESVRMGLNLQVGGNPPTDTTPPLAPTGLQVVQGGEPPPPTSFPSNTALLDNFNRPDAPLGANWSSRILVGDFEPATFVNSFLSSPGVWSGGGPPLTEYGSSVWITPFAADQEITWTVEYKDVAGSILELWGRVANPGTASVSGYVLRLQVQAGPDEWTWYRYSGGTYTAISPVVPMEFSNGHGIGFRLNGDTLTGYLNTGAGWVSVVTTTDSTVTNGGQIGMRIGGWNAILDNVTGGAISP